ncbi:atrial natriuretic peptide receptor 2-like [Physella acuta]|uniref:atrial natriuretic peptide receptor 2-like n=1 Tax=Physella acuta TaxID=109671 RepID=UPI0027DE27F9|nr:atrial natriuretic peptide receptor 2-like [Physella acuta]
MPLYHETAPIHWILGHPPLTEPLCGFDNSKCPIKKISDWVIATSVSAIILFVMILVVSLVLVLRHCIYEKKLDRLAWKIDRSEIQLLNDGQFRELTTPARPRKKDSLTGNQLRKIYFLQDTDEEISEKSYRSEVIPVGFYRGTYVVVKQVTRKHMEVNRMVKKQLQMRKELTHDNINRFIGACVEPPNMFIVTQYCPRKSLQDLLNDECSPIDDMFTTSLVQDLIRGMTFIHDAFGYHGNLKSSNCLVDSRWTLKVTDFGYTVLGPEPRPKVEDESFYKGLLWTAPELLRNRRNVSTSSHQPSYHHMNSISSTSSGSTNSSLRVTGSAKGDVYSFAIILNELYGRAGPWGLNKMTAREIVERLMVSTVPEFRPDTSNLTTKNQIIVSLIHECWHQNPEVRPDFKYGIRAKFKPIQQGFLKSNIFDNMIDMMEKYANNLEAVVAERTEQLRVEKRMTENLLLRMLPRSVAEKLKHGHQVEPEQYEHVSIYFSDIVGFTQMSASSTPMEVVDLLNDLYTCFDSIIEEFDVYKVETIGDAYMVVSGLPIRNGDRHAGEIASMALLLLEAIKLKRFKIQGSNNTTLKIRIGIHSGPCCAGVVGLKMPRYCLFGDTVNTANRLESTGEALKIHCSADTKKILDKLGGYHLEERGYTEMKGKGSLLTYFLLSEDQNHRYRRLSRYKRSGNTSRCVSASNLDYSGKSYSLSSKMFSQNPDRVSTNSSLNSSMDSSDNPEDMSPSYMAFDDKMSVHLPSYNHDFVASTLPRATLPKYNGHMSPIAECPGGQSECSGQNESLLEKTVSFPNSPYHEGYSETVSLLNGTAQWPDGPSGVMAKKRSISSRSGLNHSKPNGWAAQWFADPNVCHLDYTSNDESTM